MVNLPLSFTEYTRQLMGDERFERYLQSFEEEAPVSIRLNPKKVGSERGERKEERGERREERGKRKEERGERNV